MASKYARRSLLYMPGSSMKMLQKAVTLQPDAVILDLEDAVSISEKELARRQVVEMLPQIKASGKEVLVRVNGMDTSWGVEDLQAVVPCRPDAVVLPKANRQYILTADCILSALEKKHGLPENSIGMVPLFETTEAIVTGYEILGLCQRINGVQFGAEDLTKEMEIPRTPSGEEIRYAREQLIFAARARGIDSLDTPFTGVKDLEGLEKDVANAKAMGFTGKTCIHPSHIDTIHRLFTPTEEEVARARGIVAAMEEAVAQGKGACMYENKMVDAPVAERARKVVEKAERIAALQQREI